MAELEEAIHDYLDHRSSTPKPFVWTKTATAVLEKEARAKDALESVKTGNQPLVSEHSARLLLAYAHGHPRTMREVELNATLSITDVYLQALKEVNESAKREDNTATLGDNAKVIEHETAD